MRFLSIVFAVFMLCTACANANVAKKSIPYDKDPVKHAALVLDADTGKVLYHEKGFSKRYPASLTKMMTLYMLFDAMRAGKLSTNSKMTASKLAASQPQTNISLRAGHRISVNLAIKALVVRSANDVAVVVAEKLGGTQSRFAKMMTAKARSLGMKHTQFKNPHGLPNAAQYTTAYDMAVLGTSLRRDFPQYYNYFKSKQFTYRGKVFKGHNKVLDMYAGVDGIKTGYIRKSGFNVVSSVKKDGYNIVAVVMGGKSSKTRDKYMVSTLSRTFSHLKRQKHSPRLIAKAPFPTANPHRVRGLKSGIADAMPKPLGNASGISNAAITKPKTTKSTAPKPILKLKKQPSNSFSITPKVKPVSSFDALDISPNNKVATKNIAKPRAVATKTAKIAAKAPSFSFSLNDAVITKKPAVKISVAAPSKSVQGIVLVFQAVLSQIRLISSCQS